MRNLLLALLFLSQIGLAQHAWEKKPYQKWSAREVDQLLSDSPWAKTAIVGTANLPSLGAGRPRRSSSLTSDDVSYESAPIVSYQVQLRSALPVRQAVARKLQLDNNYDSMPDDRCAKFDAKINEYLSRNSDDAVIVQVSYTSNVPPYLSDIRRYWTAQTADMLKNSMFLNAGGKKLELTSFVAGQGVFQATFERSKDVGPSSNFSFEFQSPKFGVIADQRVLVEFKPKEMMLNGTLVF